MADPIIAPGQHVLTAYYDNPVNPHSLKQLGCVLADPSLEDSIAFVAKCPVTPSVGQYKGIYSIYDHLSKIADLFPLKVTSPLVSLGEGKMTVNTLDNKICIKGDEKTGYHIIPALGEPYFLQFFSKEYKGISLKISQVIYEEKEPCWIHQFDKIEHVRDGRHFECVNLDDLLESKYLELRKLKKTPQIQIGTLFSSVVVMALVPSLIRNGIRIMHFIRRANFLWA